MGLFVWRTIMNDVANLKARINALAQIKAKVRELIDRYEKDLLMYVVEDTQDHEENAEITRNLSLMRKIEVRTLEKVIRDLENIIAHQ